MKEGNCDRCGLWGFLERHHMKKKKFGGSDNPINIKWLHHNCHMDVHDHRGKWKQFVTRSFQAEGQTVADYENEIKMCSD